MQGIHGIAHQPAQSYIKLKVLAILDVVLRVPSVFMVDALLNYQIPLPWHTRPVLAVILSIIGLVLASVAFFLSIRVLLKFYGAVIAISILGTSSWWNQVFIGQFNEAIEESQSVRDFIESSDFQMYLFVQLAYATVFTVTIRTQHFLITEVMVFTAFLFPMIVRLNLPLDLEETNTSQYAVYTFSQYFAVAAPMLALVATVAMKISWIYYTTKYSLMLVKHIIRNYGLQIFLEDQWQRLHVPTVLRVFWLSRFALQCVFLTIMVMSQEEDKFDLLNAGKVWQIFTNLMISGCDSTLTVLGMSAVVSSITHHVGIFIQSIIGSNVDEEKHMGTVSAILFFILALQTGLSGLAPEQRLTRLYRNFCLLLTAIMHFVHNMVNPVLMSLSASHNLSVYRHLRVVSVCLILLVVAPWLMIHLWSNYHISTWLLAVSAFCVEVCIKVIISLMVYSLFIIDAYRNTFWEGLDDYVYYIKAFGNSVEFLFGIFLFGNGAWIMVFESGGTIRAVMMCIHAYFNIWQQAKSGWKIFMNRRTAVKKINSLPEATLDQLSDRNDVCAICYQDLITARITPCNHFFHSLCLRKWLYVQDNCPLCHSDIYQTEKPDDAPPEGDVNNANDDQMPDNENLHHRHVHLPEGAVVPDPSNPSPINSNDQENNVPRSSQNDHEHLD
ncbi:E3 ubiquitin-protein ligase RNF139-like [Saccoglossus kowalevskii]|uniref:E3 ubiquitin-protein ligase RNF139-like n=1 Tax=Saccoglossus kowalevskii TaxID=10224 RepID=A0ABM0H1U6_SACKO|nr:PREDICTED: E3 ubiquitin-protein ligase RNF139-like [Saccoglossus kowalevskii]